MLPSSPQLSPHVSAVTSSRSLPLLSSLLTSLPTTSPALYVSIVRGYHISHLRWSYVQSLHEAKSSTIYTAMPSRTAHGGYFRLDTAQKLKEQILLTASPHTGAPA